MKHRFSFLFLLLITTSIYIVGMNGKDTRHNRKREAMKHNVYVQISKTPMSPSDKRSQQGAKRIDRQSEVRREVVILKK